MSAPDVIRQVVGPARIIVWRWLPYFMRVLFALRLRTQVGLGTFAVDCKGSMYVDPALAAQWGPRGCATLMAHEVQHIILDHRGRVDTMAATLQARYNAVAHVIAEQHDAHTWHQFANLCADLEINDHMPKACEWPEGFTPVLPQTRQLPVGQSLEQYATALIERAEKEKIDGTESRVQGPSTNVEDEARAAAAAHEEDGEEGSDATDHSEAQGQASDGDGDDHADNGAPGAQGGDDGDQHETADAGRDEPSEPPPADNTAVGNGRAGEEGRGNVGQGWCGGCAGHPHDFEEVDDEGDTRDPIDVEILRRQVALDIQDAVSRGEDPGAFWLDWSNQLLAPPKIDYHALLRRALRGAITNARARVDYVMGPPTRRRTVLVAHLGDDAPLIPAMRGPDPRVVFLQDTSGSMMGEATTRATLAEAMGIVKASGTDVWGIAVDAAVQDMRRVSTVADLYELNKGGGGTDMRVGIAEAGKREHRADIIVVFTDGITPWPAPHDMPPRAEVVTVLIGGERAGWPMPPHIKANHVEVPL